MAQTGYTPIVLYASGTATNTPIAGNLASGELAINYADGKLFYKDSSGVVQVLATKGGVGSSTTTQVLYNSSGLVVGSSSLVFSGTALGVGGTGDPFGRGYTNIIGVTSSGTAAVEINASTGNNAYLDMGANGTRYFNINSNATNTSLSTIGSFPLTFAINGSEAMRIDTSGNVGIGTSSPDAKLSLKSPSVSGTQTILTGIAATSSTDLFALTVNQTTDVTTMGTPSGYAAPFAFQTNGSERARIDASGNLCLGQASSTVGGSSWKQAIQFTSLGIGFSCTNSSGNMANFYTSTSTFAGSITASGSTTTYATSSDYRLKENIAPMIDALAKVQALKPVTYKWKSDGTSGQGFIAHELQAIVPDCVVGKKDAVETVDDVDTDGKVIGTKEVPKYQGIDTSFLVAILTAAIQEQQALIESLTTRLTALENK